MFGTAILGANYASDGAGESLAYSAAATFDFGYRGEVLLGLIGDQQSGSGFQSLEFYVLANGATIQDWSFTDLSSANGFFQNHVIDLGWYSGPDCRHDRRVQSDRKWQRRFRVRFRRRRPARRLCGSRARDLGDDADRLRRARLRRLSPGKGQPRDPRPLIVGFKGQLGRARRGGLSARCAARCNADEPTLARAWASSFCDRKQVDKPERRRNVRREDL